MTNKTLTNPYHPRRSPAGFSLIEVLVVMIILVIGIFALVRLFPGGFLTIQRTNELSQAEGLAQQQLDRIKQSLSVPDSIVAVDPTNPANILADRLPDDLEDESAMSAMMNVARYTDPYFVSNINRFNKVIGEPFQIASAANNEAIYIMQFAPVYNQFGTDANGNPTDSLLVRGEPLRRTIQQSVPNFNNPTATPILANENEYAIDYDRLKIAFFPRLGTGSRQFVFGYEYLKRDANNNVQVVSVLPNPATPQTTTITIPDVNPNSLRVGQVFPEPLWVDIFADPMVPNTPGVLRPTDFDPVLKLNLNEEEVSRKFRLLTATTGATPTWSVDPYEYVWKSPQRVNDGNDGVLIFNPAGINVSSNGSNGGRPIVARIDYVIFDNHIIREDRGMPVRAPYDVRLSLQFIRLNGHVADPVEYDLLTAYTGLFRGGSNTPDVLVYNTGTGELVGQWSAGASTGVVGMSVDDRTGILRFNEADVERLGLQTASLRVFYRTEKQWGMSFQKANSRYYPETQPLNVEYNEFYLGGSAGAGIGSNTRVYFPLCESGKTVILSEYYVRDTNGNQLRFDNEAYQINANPNAFESVQGRLMTWIDLSSQHAQATMDGWVFDSTQTGRAISNVRGGSLRSRVVWRDAGKWRKVDLDTFLSQKPIR